MKSLHLDCFIPPIEDLIQGLRCGVERNFGHADVSLVDSPDFRNEPFLLPFKGLCGNVVISDAGGTGYMFPEVCRDKFYKYTDVLNCFDHASSQHEQQQQDRIIIGAGAGPFHKLGQNSEMVCLATSSNGTLRDFSKLIKIDNTHDLGYRLIDSPAPEFGVLGNFLCSDGLPGKVIKIEARKRIGEENIMSCIRKALSRTFGEKFFALGGVILIETGSAKFHVMPDFSPTPITTTEQERKWLRFFEMPSPVVCVGTIISYDYPGYDIRLEHFHGYNRKVGCGGHYHFDTTPNTVSYTAYLTTASDFYRIDKPLIAQSLGKHMD